MIDSFIEPLFQPIFDKSGQVFAYEALLRFKGHSISPARLIRRWEQSGHIATVDLAMVRRVGAILARNGTRPRITLNVSIVTVETAGDAYMQALAAIAPFAALLIVELTETATVSDSEALARFYMACRHLGFAVALDDCQPGHLYGDLGFLEAFRPQFVKLDGLYLQASFKAGHANGLRRLIEAAHAGNAPVIAEHISSLPLRDYVFQLGVDYAQGFALGMPAPLPIPAEGKKPGINL